MVKGSVNFLFLPNWRCSMAACGGSISNVLYNVLIASSSSWGVRPGSSSRRLLIWFRCLLCVAVGPRMMYVVFWILLSIFLSSQKGVLLLKALKKNLSPGLYLFVGTVVVLPRLACFVSSFSKTGRIFCANIVSAGDVASGVFGFGVIW